MNNQSVNTDTCGGDRVFAQQRVVDPCDFSMAQYWQHNQHQFFSHQDVNIQVFHMIYFHKRMTYIQPMP